MNRKKFLLSSAAASAAVVLTPVRTWAGTDTPPYPIDIVKDFVIAGHGNLSKVQEMLQQYPNLLYCRYDWGNGDFEEAIEGAGHVGNKEIAQWLIGQGARPNLFVLTMLGEAEIVKSVIDKYPSLLMAKGAHGLTLLHHALKGGDDSKELVDYLKEKGLTEMQIRIK